MRANIIALALFCFANAFAWAQQPASTLPPSVPTALAPSVLAPSAAQPASTPVASVTPALVTWKNQRLTVTCAGTPLADLLRQVGAQTGLVVTGSPGRDPIYGTYGPGDLDGVVSNILDGLPLNLILAHEGNRPTLTLSPRTGGVSAPAPPALSTATDPDLEYLRQAAQPPRSQTSPVRPGIDGREPETSQPQGSGSALPASPNGVRTPAEIMQQLQQMRQQQGAPVRPDD